MSSASSHSGKYRLPSHDGKLSKSGIRPEGPVFTDDSPGSQEELLPPVYHPDVTPGASLQPSTPGDFAVLFPSLNPFTIGHDNFGSDGNMNIVVDVPSPHIDKLGGRIQLFHLKMVNLSTREFSLRRYSRDSGDEFSWSRRKYVELDTRPILQRSFEQVIEKLGNRLTGHEFEPDIIDARDSLAATGGYSPWVSVDNDIGDIKEFKSTDVIRLGFQNYSTVELEYVSSRKARSYQFSFWHRDYIWNWVVDQDLISLHLFEGRQRKNPVASIVPIASSPKQIQANEATGAWVPPCQMRFIEDNVLYNDQLAEYSSPVPLRPWRTTIFQLTSSIE